jgi:probable F420-dependent oxidoreductase
MRLAVRVPTSNQVASRSTIVDVAQAAEALGFYAVSAHDHIIFNGWWVACGAKDWRGEGDDRDMYELLTTLSFIAGKTERVRLMAGVIVVPMRETVLMAKQLATLDVLSEGRVLLGVGIGSQVDRNANDRHANDMKLGAHAVNALKEYETFNVPRQRGKMADEQLAAMRAIWTDEVASFDGKFVQFREIEVFPKPVQPGGPPILIGGRSPAALQRAVRYGDGWLPNSISPQQYAEGVATLRQLATDAGKPAPSQLALNIFTTVGATDAEALEVFRPTVGRVFSDEALIAGNLVGSPDTVARRLCEFQAAGVNLIEMKPIYRGVPDLIRQMELLAREVMPVVAAAAPALPA